MPSSSKFKPIECAQHIIGLDMIIFDALSLRAIRHRLDKRKLQEELDLHRLFLLTSYHARRHDNFDADQLAAALDSEAQQLGAEGMRSAVAEHLVQQLTHLAELLHSALAAPAINDDAAAQNLANFWISNTRPTPIPSTTHTGLGSAVKSNPSSLPSPPTTTTYSSPRLSQHQVAEEFLNNSGFTLHIAPSSIPHSDAGDGVWLKGQADVGQIVALYPGTAYPPLTHRQIPGYPLVARSNPFLFSRFDGVVLDAKPWGRGLVLDDSDDENQWPVGELQNEAEKGLGRLEGRNPLALAHFANHPPTGMMPNVVVAAVDYNNNYFSLDLEGRAGTEEKEKILREMAASRVYIPVVQYKDANNTLPEPQDAAPCVALVATRQIENEELFLNYRLNPNAPGGLPEWYSPVDADEDARRWA